MKNKNLESVLKEFGLEAIKDDIIRVMYHHYETDISFPRSCGSVSMIMTYLLHCRDLHSIYDIKYIRGYYRNLEMEDDACDEVLDAIEEDSFKYLDCTDCSCEFMNVHSWIELKNKNNNEQIILDLTSIQFEEDYGDYRDDIVNSHFDSIELMDYICSNSNIIVNSGSSNFLNYIKTEDSLSSKELFDLTKEILNEGSDSELTLILKEMDYETEKDAV